MSAAVRHAGIIVGFVVGFVALLYLAILVLPLLTLDALGVPLWLLAIPPLVAGVAIVVWLIAPHLHRDPTLRGVLIVSAGVAGLEVMLVALVAGFLMLLSLSGGARDF